MGFAVKAVSEVGEGGVELSEEVFVRQAAPFTAEHGFVPGGADAALEGERVGIAGEHGGDPVAMLDEAVGGGEDSRVHAAEAEDFAPKPFAGVNAAAFGHDVGAKLGAELGNLGGFSITGVVFPEPDHGVEVVFKLRQEAERGAAAVHGDGGGASGVDADADDLGGIEAGDLRGGLLQGSTRDGFEAIEVILRVLAGDVGVFRIEQDAHLAAGVVEDGGADFCAVFEVDEEGAAGVRAVVDAEGVAFHSGDVGGK